MTKLETVQRAVDYIEENLKSEIAVEDLVRESHFSRSHFLHLFQTAVGTPCMKYIARRRLLWALYEMKAGKKGIEAALDYGYDTYAGFYKAFRREFGCTPSIYLSRYAIGRPHRLNLQQEEHFMVSEQKLQRILANWEGTFEGVKPVHFSNGEVADNMWTMLEASGKRYILSACAGEASLKRCLELSRLEAREGLAAALPVPARNGEDYVTDGDLCFYLSEKKKVIGERRNPTEFYRVPGQAREVGRILAVLHRSLKEAAVNELYEEGDDLEAILGVLPEVKARVDLPEEFYREYEETLKKLAPRLPRQLIHRDPNDGNIILENGRCAGFLHFELAQINFRIFDLAYAATAVLSEIYMQDEEGARPAEGIWLPIYRNIAEGYDGESPLSREERQALPYMVFSIQFICVAYFNRFDKFRRIAAANEKMLRWLWEKREELLLFQE